jgi:hypothetical protein
VPLNVAEAIDYRLARQLPTTAPSTSLSCF